MPSFTNVMKLGGGGSGGRGGGGGGGGTGKTWKNAKEVKTVKEVLKNEEKVKRNATMDVERRVPTR